ncbi:DUF3667 domain-containing protein [Christiangramia echinicola]|uniref:Zinc-ribbon domain-containing protein n=1 Tax=Christiangramia echinicola TaxID=279359 RepID=A0A1H1LEK6_9FLAO|nr:DUF3667 domain-containing protein [Christiangramia echinicola]SDR72752.1 zinc-ribbon domain-containing protein [Christiangramia echinicola]
MFCKNCGQSIKANDKYCSECGARIIEGRLTVSKLSGEFMQSFWSMDSNKPLLTFLDLFRKPIQVIDGYIHGLRKKYINPYGYFTIALTLTGLYTYINLNYFPEYLESSGINANVEDHDISKEVTTKVLEHINLITFIFIPLITLISRFIFLRIKKYNLAEHFIIHLYAYSHVHIITSLIVLVSFVDERAYKLSSLISIPIYIIYYSALFKRLYSLKLWKVILKTVLFLILMGIVIAVISISLLYFYLKDYQAQGI